MRDGITLYPISSLQSDAPSRLPSLILHGGKLWQLPNGRQGFNWTIANYGEQRREAEGASSWTDLTDLSSWSIMERPGLHIHQCKDPHLHLWLICCAGEY